MVPAAMAGVAASTQASANLDTGSGRIECRPRLVAQRIFAA
jgi:hypothetical protein